jgi:hypothetical protein
MRWAAATLLLTCLTLSVLAQGNNPSPSEQIEVIEQAREIALRYTDNLPNFVATQTSRRQYLEKGSRNWKPIDTLVFEVAFLEGDERYTLLTINGKPTETSKDETRGFDVEGEFGTILSETFNPKAEAKFRWERHGDLRGRPVHVFSYHVEEDHSGLGGGFKDDNGKENRGMFAYGGHVYIDRESHQVMGLTHVFEGIPADWPISALSGKLDYGFVGIDGKQFLLPLHAETLGTWKAGVQHRTLVEFSNYRMFSTGVTIAPVN